MNKEITKNQLTSLCATIFPLDAEPLPTLDVVEEESEYWSTESDLDFSPIYPDGPQTCFVELFTSSRTLKSKLNNQNSIL